MTERAPCSRWSRDPGGACAPQDSHSPLQTFHSLTQHPETPLFMTDMARASGKCSPNLRRTSLKQDVSVAACYACNAGDPGSIPGLGRSPGEGKGYPTPDSLVAQEVKNQLAMRETWVQSLGWEDPLEKGKATPSSIFAWRIPWTIQSPWDRKELDTERLSLHFTSLPVFLPGEVHGQRSLEGYKSMRSQRVGSTQYI